MTYNRTEAAIAMLAQIEAWCAKTATPENSIGHVLFLHPGFVALLRKRLTLSEDKEAQVREFMAQHPTGWRGELPQTHANGTRPRRPWKSAFRAQRGSHEVQSVEKLTDEEIAQRRTDRDPCQRCGVRHDIGCHHTRAPVGMVL